MHHLAALSTLFLLVTVTHAQHAALFDELAILYPDSDGAAGTARYAGDTPRGVPAGVHVLVTGLPANDTLRYRLLRDNRDVSAATVYQFIDVPVEQNTGLRQRTEAWDDDENPHVVREAPFRVFEVLEPIDHELTASATGVAALRFEIPIRVDAPPGPRSYEIRIGDSAWRTSLMWDLTVHAAVVPPTSSSSRGYTNWFSIGHIAKYHKLTHWSSEHWRMIRRYAQLMARGRQNTFILRWQQFIHRNDDGTFRANHERLHRYVQIFLALGFNRVEGGHIASRHKGDWSSPRLDLAYTRSDITTEQGRAEAAALLRAIRAALEKLDLPPEVTYLQHLSDEPTDTNAASYSALADLAREHLPDVKIFEATMSRQVVAAVDVWCPQIYAYQRHRDFFAERIDAGDEVWVYTCLSPGGPWLNRLLDQERLRQVYFGWALEKYDLAGFLHWGLNHYRADPFAQSVVPHSGGDKSFLPAGDSHIVYPGSDGPLSGQRFEAHRIGMEDGELLRMLESRNPQQAATIIGSILRSFHDYEKNVAKYRAARRTLLAALAAPNPQ